MDTEESLPGSPAAGERDTTVTLNTSKLIVTIGHTKRKAEETTDCDRTVTVTLSGNLKIDIG
jgi:hypothetical protein